MSPEGHVEFARHGEKVRNRFQVGHSPGFFGDIKSEAFLETPGASLVCALSSTFGVAMLVVRF
jgi:hypothetical protein